MALETVVYAVSEAENIALNNINKKRIIEYKMYCHGAPVEVEAPDAEFKVL